MTIADRFWSKVAVGDGCWEWQAYRDKDGYGRMNRDGSPSVKVPAHRVSYELNVGPIPAGLLVLHACDNPPCVNPDHLFLGTARDNAQDMSRKLRGRGQDEERCANGHLRSPENSYVRKGRLGMNRQCRVCDKQRKAAARKAVPR